MTPEQEQLKREYDASRELAQKAWERLDFAWQNGHQGTEEGRETLRELNVATAASGAAYERYVASF